jgi:phosphoglycolate phosphatase
LKYKAVLFDLDGTLLDTLEDLAGAVNQGLTLLGFPQHKLESYKYFVGSGREEMAFRALPEAERRPLTLKRLVDFIDGYYLQHWADHTLPYPGIPDLLDELTARKIKLSILSNKPQIFTDLMVGRLLAKWSFAAVAGAMPGVPKKPDPSAALKIAEKLKLGPRELVYLGDSDIDMQTAAACGMFAVGALWGFRTADELKASGANSLINHPCELLRFLE